MESYRDFTVGLFILASIGIILGLLVITSNALDDRQDFYMRAATADGLTQDTRVSLRGLQIGRVTQVNPRVDDAGVSFVARLSLRRTYPDGTLLQLPVGTRAVIAAPLPISIAAAAVDLEIPGQAAGTEFLQPGDTIDSDRIPGAVDLLGQVATALKSEVLQTLAQTQVLIEQSTRTIAETHGIIESTQRLIGTTTPKVEQALELLAASLERTDQILAEISPRVGPLQDSLMATLAQARRILTSFDTLATTAHELLAENRNVIQEALARLAHTTTVLDHFAEQVTRRPLRFLTGVTLPPPDTTEKRR
ncbi:MAG: MlaD family protein [Gemmatimonadetes bacterium]|nr:MlaD family protein [Gemmatimonadota bacterium]